MADYHDATGGDLTLSVPAKDKTWYYFIEGTLGFVEGPGENGDPPQGVWNFIVTGPTTPKPFTSLANQVPVKLTRLPFWRRALLSGILAEVWDELASQTDDDREMRRHANRRDTETIRYERLKAKMRQYVRAQMAPTKPIRSDV